MQPRVLNFETCHFILLVLIHISKHVCKKNMPKIAQSLFSRGGGAPRDCVRLKRARVDRVNVCLTSTQRTVTCILPLSYWGKINVHVGTKTNILYYKAKLETSQFESLLCLLTVYFP